MAQLLSPVCTEALKFQNPLSCSRSSWGMLTKIRNPSTVEVGRGAKRRGCGSGRVKVATDNSASTKADADDYYEVLGLEPKESFLLLLILYLEFIGFDPMNFSVGTGHTQNIVNCL
uniref:Uncharacterized protein n=1 Tax=Fagus sylvatica TaxID=28930 RepID=A0A2N9HAD7_FAGSY